ncbi:sigma-70 family RNA polymerase sigma factor [Paenibacillus graminis]|uniref:sigma-70 family RNA polymerase sigma factor n=1 Tax=Paenibacillus graminis TaxID=189425 RepID=UPI002DBA338E|nr:sigma-70 family RNA polymerase sigma factor [Paenibacillus graminis]MEC0167924.1 sigma-70 family RNA polymerase sigma factor [Paenibacillus graminis]
MNFPDNPLLGPLSRADFITANTPLVDTIVYRYFRSQLAATRTPRSDATNDGIIGLINAYDRYNDASVFFGTFAFPHIYGEIANALSRRPTSGVRIPEWLYPLIKRVNSAGLADSSAEAVALELGIAVKRARQALRCIRISKTDELAEEDARGQTDDYTHLAADEFITRLKPKPQRIIRMLMAEYTQSEVARSLDMSRQAVRATILRVRADYERYEKISA